MSAKKSKPSEKIRLVMDFLEAKMMNFSTKEEIADRTGLSKKTVDAVIRYLMDQGKVQISSNYKNRKEPHYRLTDESDILLDNRAVHGGIYAMTMAKAKSKVVIGTIFQGNRDDGDTYIARVVGIYPHHVVLSDKHSFTWVEIAQVLKGTSKGIKIYT